MKCNLADCILPVEYLSIFKKTERFKGFYCKFHYPEAWDLEGLGFNVTVIRLIDYNHVPKRPRYNNTKMCYINEEE